MGCASVHRERRRSLPEGPGPKLTSVARDTRAMRPTNPASRSCSIALSRLALPAQPILPCHPPHLCSGLAIVMRKLDKADEFRTGLLLDPARRQIGSRITDVEALDAE